MTALIVPALLVTVAAWCVYKKVDLFSAMTAGAKDGWQVVISILPSLVVLLTVVYMLRASGALEALAKLCAPLFSLLGIPAETAALIFLRPVSGSGALAVGSEIMSRFGPDSYLGRCAAVMLGSTETTFYTMTVYLSSAQEKTPRFLLPAAICGDIAGFIASSFFVKLFFN